MRGGGPRGPARLVVARRISGRRGKPPMSENSTKELGQVIQSARSKKVGYIFDPRRPTTSNVSLVRVFHKALTAKRTARPTGPLYGRSQGCEESGRPYRFRNATSQRRHRQIHQEDDLAPITMGGYTRWNSVSRGIVGGCPWPWVHVGVRQPRVTSVLLRRNDI